MGKNSKEVPGLPTLPQGYEYIEEISSGNYGTVWLVRNNNVNRNEAAKILHRTGDIEYQRFCHEIETIATLDHPNIVTIYYANPEEFYFIMEYLEHSFDQRIRRKDSSTYEGIKILKQVAKGLHFAHQKGLIHRDLKPGNILFSSQMVPKITDFGLVKNVHIANFGKDDLTGSHSIGTPRYMAPEQWENPKIVDHKCDIWPLGIMLYEILTKQYPFDNMSGIQLANAIINKPIPRPGKVCALSQWGAMAEPICMKALERDLTKRYQTAEQMERDLAKILTVEEGTSEVFISHTEENPRMQNLAITAVRDPVVRVYSNRSGHWKWILLLAIVLLLTTTWVSLMVYFHDKDKEQQRLSFKHQISKLEEKIASYEQELQGNLQYKQELQQQKLLSDEREKMNAKQISQFTRLISQLEKQIHEYRKQILLAEKKLVENKLYLEEAQLQQQQYDEKIRALANEKSELNDKMEGVKRQLHSAQKQIARQQQQIAEQRQLFETHRQKGTKTDGKIAELNQEIERLLPFENQLYKITLVSSRRDLSQIYEALDKAGFAMKRSVFVKRNENTCIYFTGENNPSPEIEKKVRYIIKIIGSFIPATINIRHVQARHLDKEVKIELAGE